jgi:hypothetical protein
MADQNSFFQFVASDPTLSALPIELSLLNGDVNLPDFDNATTTSLPYTKLLQELGSPYDVCSGQRYVSYLYDQHAFNRL